MKITRGEIYSFSEEKDLEDSTKGMERLSLSRNEHYRDNKGKRQFSSYWKVLAEKIINNNWRQKL